MYSYSGWYALHEVDSARFRGRELLVAKLEGAF